MIANGVVSGSTLEIIDMELVVNDSNILMIILIMVILLFCGVFLASLFVRHFN